MATGASDEAMCGRMVDSGQLAQGTYSKTCFLIFPSRRIIK